MKEPEKKPTLGEVLAQTSKLMLLKKTAKRQRPHTRIHVHVSDQCGHSLSQIIPEQ